MGPRNPIVADILTRNKQFIQVEAGKEYPAYQIANAGGSGIWNGFSFDNAKCQRDIGLITDAIIWDIKHGYNERSREIAQSYFSSAGASYVSGQEANT